MLTVQSNAVVLPPGDTCKSVKPSSLSERIRGSQPWLSLCVMVLLLVHFHRIENAYQQIRKAPLSTAISQFLCVWHAGVPTSSCNSTEHFCEREIGCVVP